MSVLQVDDQSRLAAIAAYGALTSPPPELNELVFLAARLAGTPLAAIDIVTDTHQHQVATYGFAAGIRRRSESLCNVVLDSGQALVITDTVADPRFADNPHVDGSYAKVRFCAGFPLATSDGVTIGTLCVFDLEPRSLSSELTYGLEALAARIIDVFELRVRSRELSLSQMETQSSQAELVRTNDRLASFAGQVSHDLKTPLTTLSLSLSLIRDELGQGVTGPDLVPLLDRAINGSIRMSDLIDDVLDYARLGGTLEAGEVDLDVLLAKVLADLGREIDDAEISIGRLPTVRGDRSELRAVLETVVGNAVKFRHLDRPLELSITSRHVQRAWRVEITDNGIGLTPSQRHQIFQPVVRIDDAPQGGGIGLSTCRRIVGAHGGSMGLDPSITDGTRFWFELPD